MYSHLATPCIRVGQGDRDTRIVNWRDESADRGFDLQDRKNKILFHILMSAECESARNYGSKTLTQYWSIIRWLTNQRKAGWSFSPCPRRAMEGHSFWLGVRLNTGLGMKFLYLPYPMIALWGHWSSVSIGWSIRAMYSGVWTPIKEDPEKGIDRLKAGSADRRLAALATLFATTALPRVLNLTAPSNISLLKTDSRLTVIASQLISQLKLLLVVIHDFFLIIV